MIDTSDSILCGYQQAILDLMNGRIFKLQHEQQQDLEEQTSLGFIYDE